MLMVCDLIRKCRRLRGLCSVFVTLCSLPGWAANLSLPAVFSDHMVLQRHQEVPVWGRALAGERIQLSFANQRISTVADAQGNWQVSLAPMPANSEPLSMLIRSDTEERVLHNILVGEVWLASGQSNMRMTVQESLPDQRGIAIATHPHIRLLDFTTSEFYPTERAFDVDKLAGLTAQNFFSSNGWQVSHAKSNGSFSAVAFYFAVELQQALQVPVGVINVSVGGALTENFIAESALAVNTKLAHLAPSVNPDWIDQIAPWCAQRAKLNLRQWLEKHPTQPLPHHAFEPGFLYLAGIAPLARFALQGVIWYQGESNAPLEGDDNSYHGSHALSLSKHKLETLISSWREQWQRADMPFLLVQLPGLNRPWAPYRNMQQKVADELSAVGLMVSYDLGEATDVHPKNKAAVGHRLARLAQQKVYSLEQAYPQLQLRRIDRLGTNVLLFFNAPVQLAFSDTPQGFMLAGKDGKFYPATAQLQHQSLSLQSASVSRPCFLRYAWFDDPKPLANVYSQQGLPLSPLNIELQACKVRLPQAD